MKTFSVTLGEIGRLDILLTAAAATLSPPPSRVAVQRHIRGGLVEADGEVVTDPSAKMKGGEKVEVRWTTEPSPRLKPQNLTFGVVFEDDYIIVVDKPPGLVVHPGAGNPDGTLVNGLLAHCRGRIGGGERGRPGIVHRLDKDSSGLLVVAKDEAAHAALAGQFERRVAKRFYWAAIRGVPEGEGGAVEAPLARHPTNRLKMAVSDRGKPAFTKWRRLRAFYGANGEPLAALIFCGLKSGRTHQIRAHMAAMGHPLLGDEIYGGRDAKKWADRQALHAVSLGFFHPRSRLWRRFKSPLPDDLTKLAKRLLSSSGDGRLGEGY